MEFVQRILLKHQTHILLEQILQTIIAVQNEGTEEMKTSRPVHQLEALA